MKNLKLVANGLVICALLGFVATGCGQKVQTPTEEPTPTQEEQTLEQNPMQQPEAGMKNEMEQKTTTPEEKKTETTTPAPESAPADKTAQ